MSETKHTPGPWTFDVPTEEQHPGYLFGGKDICIWAGPRDAWLANVERRACCVHPNGLACHPQGHLLVCTLTDEINAEQEANARLIAAAPELLEALRAFVEWGAMTGSDRDMFVRRFRDVIAKAEGK